MACIVSACGARRKTAAAAQRRSLGGREGLIWMGGRAAVLRRHGAVCDSHPLDGMDGPNKLVVRSKWPDRGTSHPPCVPLQEREPGEVPRTTCGLQARRCNALAAAGATVKSTGGSPVVEAFTTHATRTDRGKHSKLKRAHNQRSYCTCPPQPTSTIVATLGHTDQHRPIYAGMAPAARAVLIAAFVAVAALQVSVLAPVAWRSARGTTARHLPACSQNTRCGWLTPSSLALACTGRRWRLVRTALHDGAWRRGEEESGAPGAS